MPQIKTTGPYAKRIRQITLLGFCVLFLFALLQGHEPGSIAINSPANSLVQLAPGLTVRREVTSAAAEVFEISIEQGKLLRFSIDKGDLVLSTTVYGPTGAKLLEHLSRELEVVEISLPADVDGKYKIELLPGEKLKVPRAYELKVGPLADVTETDRKDSEARQLLAGAEVLWANWTAPDLRQARDKFDRAAKISASINDFSSAALATLKAGDICFRLSEFAEGHERYKNAESYAQRAGNRLLRGKALGLIGLVYSYLGDNDQAQNYVNSAHDLLNFAARDSNPLVRTVYGEALANMGEVSYSKGNFARAFEEFKEARKYLDHDRKGLARVVLFAGFIAGSLGDADQALDEFLQARELSAAVNDRAGEGVSLTGFGMFHTFKGPLDHAIEFHKQAREVFRSIGDRHNEAIALNGLSQAYQKRNNIQYALISAEDSLRLLESTGSLDAVAVATFKLAELNQQVGNHDQAFKYLERSLALSRAAKKVRNEANALSEIAIVYASLKRPDEAEKRHRNAQSFYKSIGDRRGQATALRKYGEFLLKIDHKHKALNIYNQAVALSETMGDKDLLTSSLYGLTQTHQALGNYDLGLGAIERSIKILEELRAEVGSPELRALYFSGVGKHYDLCRDILMQLDDVRPGEDFAARAFLMSEKSRARSLVELVRESQARLREGATAELLRREREVGGLIQALAQYQMNLSFENRKESTELDEVTRQLAIRKADYQEIQDELRRQHSKLLPLTNFEVTDVKQIQKELQAGGRMLLQYALGEKQSYLWVITGDSFHSYKLPPRKEIEDRAVEVAELIRARQNVDTSAMGEYQAKVEKAGKLYFEKARILSQILLGPVAEQLRDRKLVFVTEGKLQMLQFEALPVPHRQDFATTATEPFLIEATSEIATVPSMTTLLAMRTAGKRLTSPRRVVAIIADPVFSRNDDRVGSQERSPATVRAASALSEQPVLRDGPARLVYASEEADAILAVAPRGTTLVAKGFDANRETAMSSRIGEYQIVHFATHGFLYSEHPELSGIVLTKVDQNGAAINGLMALHDIYTLDLSAQLTVLSACETALGKELKGEGVVGLSHSFMSAGSKSVVASLWKVDDEATANLMSDFYASMLRDGMPPIAALRAAKLKMMQDKRWNAPYYWAGFVFQGDYDSRITIETNSNRSLVLVLVFLAVISFGLIVFLKRRRRSSPTGQN